MADALDPPSLQIDVPRIHIDNADDYVDYVEQLQVDTQLIRSEGQFSFSGQFITLEGFGISLGHWGCQTALRGRMDGHTVAFAMRGGGSVMDYGRLQHDERGLILGVDSPEVDLVFGSRLSTLAITFAPNLIRDHLRTLVGDERAPLVLDKHIDLRSRSGLYLQRLAQHLVAEIERRPAALADPRAFNGLRESFLHTLLASQVRTDVLERPSLDVGERRVLALEGYIEEHLDQALTLGELAAQVGISVRAVQQAFRRYRGLTPSHFIRLRRLERAASLLRAGGESVTVLDVALDCGFTHTGRFARSYREHFGEQPSETLRHGRRLCRSSAVEHHPGRASAASRPGAGVR